MVNRKAQELISRNGKVERWSAWVGLISMDADPNTRVRKSLSTITLYGTFDAPVKGTAQFEISFGEGVPEVGVSRPQAIGAFFKAKPKLQGHLTLHASEFQMMLTLATTGNLHFLSCSFEVPRYGFGKITNMDFGNEYPEK